MTPLIDVISVALMGAIGITTLDWLVKGRIKISRSQRHQHQQ